MRRQFDFRLFAIISFLTVLVVSFSSLNVRLPSLSPLLSKYLVSDAASHQTRDSPRRSLLILGKGRSGTSFVSKMFASTDRVSKLNLGPDYTANFIPRWNFSPARGRWNFVAITWRISARAEILASAPNTKLCAKSLRRIKIAPRTRVAKIGALLLS